MTGGTPLGMDAIEALLKSEPKSKQSAQGGTVLSPHARPIHIGLLRWGEKTERCVSRNCSGPTYVRIGGIPYCTTHALNKFNELYMQLDGTFEKYNMSDCDCNAGRHSKNNIHTEGCPVYKAIKEERDNTGD